MKIGRMDIMWRGQCGGWVLEDPRTGELTDGKALESAKLYREFYGLDDDYAPQPYDGDELCEHGVRIDGDCSACCEEFLIQQFASLRLDEGQDQATVVQFVGEMHGITDVVPATKIEALVADVFINPDAYRMEAIS